MIADPEREIVIRKVQRVLEPELTEIGRTPLARRLIAAAMLLERDGWCQHVARDSLGRRCLGGAISGVGTLIPFSLDDSDRSVDVENLLMAHAPFLIEKGVGGWNDEKGRTKEDVTHLLVRLAELADK